MKEIKSSVASEEEVSHNALDDVRYQIRLVVECNKLIKNKA